MEKFEISVAGIDELFNFQVVNNGSDKCEYEVFAGNKLVAVFEPDENEYIHICRNPGGLDEEVIVQIADRIEAHFVSKLKIHPMSSAFVKEGEYQKLSDVAPSLSALSFYLRQENGGQVIREMKSFYSEKCGRHVYEMSDGLTYALDDKNKWTIILNAC